MHLKRGTITVIFVMPCVLLLLVATWLMGGAGNERQQATSRAVGTSSTHTHSEPQYCMM